MDADEPTTPNALVHHDKLRSRNLARAVFRAEVPEVFVRRIPAQTLYMAIKQQGLESSAELLELATYEQLRLLMDFDLWRADRFSEESMWEWLQVTDATSDLALLQRILRSLDLKLVALLIERHVSCKIFEEATDLCPGPGYISPDKGSTWIKVNLEDPHSHFLLNRLLALIFETDAELFYQLVAIPDVATESMLEEEAYQDRVRRLESEGVPDLERAAAIHAPLPLDRLVSIVTRGERAPEVEDIPIIEPIVYDTHMGSAMQELLSTLTDFDAFESELTLITNAAFVHWRCDFSEREEIDKILLQVKGAINVGLEAAREATARSYSELYRTLGLQMLYRFGLHQLQALSRHAHSAAPETLRAIADDSVTVSLVAGCRETPVPLVPTWFGENLGEHIEKLPASFRPLQNLQELRSLHAILERILGNKLGD
jgi:hypothetical protein